MRAARTEGTMRFGLWIVGCGAVASWGCSGTGLVDLGDGGDGGGDATTVDVVVVDATPPLDATEPDTSTTCHPDPSNFDIPNNGCDDDGDGIVDNAPTCDTSLQLTGPAGDMAKALGLCKLASAGGWGVVSATYANGFGSTTPPAMDVQHGILSTFGSTIVPREGASFGVLSSGWAREYDQCSTPTGVFKTGCSMNAGTASTAPPGYPHGTCNPSQTIFDASALVLQIKVPKNAQGLAFDFEFLTGEWPEWACTQFSDMFVAWVDSSAITTPDKNISFDQNMQPITAASPFLQACSPANATTGCSGTMPSTSTCSLGDVQLQGTGFSDPGTYCTQTSSGGGATGWLTTRAPVAPGETITVQFMVWDTGDSQYDSSVLLDHWQWLTTPTTVATSP